MSISAEQSHEDWTFVNDRITLDLVRRHPEMVAEDMGLRFFRELTKGELDIICRYRYLADVPSDDLRNLRGADLVMEVRHPGPKVSFLAVEVSFRARVQDVAIAERNAELLSTFVGGRCYAAVAAVHRDERVERRIESSETHWYQIDPHDLE